MKVQEVLVILNKIKPLIVKSGFFLVNKIVDRVEVLDRVINSLEANNTITDSDYSKVWKMIYQYNYYYSETRYDNRTSYDVSHYGKNYASFSRQQDAVNFCRENNELIFNFLESKIEEEQTYLIIKSNPFKVSDSCEEEGFKTEVDVIKRCKELNKLETDIYTKYTHHLKTKKLYNSIGDFKFLKGYRS